MAWLGPHSLELVAMCDMQSSEGHSLHTFSQDRDLREKWIRAVKRQRKDWEGPSPSSLLYSKHFEPGCFVTEGSHYRDKYGIPSKKRLKSDAVPTKFPKPTHGSKPAAAPPSRPAAEKQQRKAVSNIYLLAIAIKLCINGY